MSDLIPLRSEEGQALVNQAKQGNGYFQPIIEMIFCKQIGRKNCGIQASALLLRANDIGKKTPQIRACDSTSAISVESDYSENAMFEMSTTKACITQDDITRRDGMTLEEVYHLLQNHGANVQMAVASDITEDLFRQQAMEALQQSNSSAGVMINYHMATLGQGLPFGHHSPLGGYHAGTDRFLLLDVWPDTQACWAKTTDLYKAMNTLDGSSGKSRGYCIAKFS